MTKRLSATCENTNRKSFIQGHNCSFKIERGLRICSTWDKKEAKNATIKHCGHCRRPCNCAAKAWFTGQKKTTLAGSNRRGKAASCSHDQTAVTARFENLGKKVSDAHFLVMDPVRNLFPPILGVSSTSSLLAGGDTATFPLKKSISCRTKVSKMLRYMKPAPRYRRKVFCFYTSTPV